MTFFFQKVVKKIKLGRWKKKKFSRTPCLLPLKNAVLFLHGDLFPRRKGKKLTHHGKALKKTFSNCASAPFLLNPLSAVSQESFRPHALLTAIWMKNAPCSWLFFPPLKKKTSLILTSAYLTCEKSNFPVDANEKSGRATPQGSHQPQELREREGLHHQAGLDQLGDVE